MKRNYICSKCAYSHHVVLPSIEGRTLSFSHVLIDGEPYTTLHRSPSHAVRCSECGQKSREVFEAVDQVEHSQGGKSVGRRSEQ
jgi:hypothetical protein